jgi:hypothetical protein
MKKFLNAVKEGNIDAVREIYKLNCPKKMSIDFTDHVSC